jgi:ferric-dicitrate binding protein FerR (iron transport regulator)
MNDFDLNAKLKSVPLPERTEEYWNDFPSQVRVQLRRSHPEFAPRPVWRPRLAWAGGLALTMAMVVVCLQFNPLQSVSLAVAKKEQHLRKQLAQLDAGLHVLMFNPHGMGYLLAEAN